MTFGGSESPGSIRYQLGLSVSAIRQATEEADIQRKADLYVNTVTVCAPHLTPEEESELRKLPALPHKDKYGSGANALNAAIERQLSNLLRKMAEKGLYAYLRHDAGDAGLLALQDEEDEGAEA